MRKFIPGGSLRRWLVALALVSLVAFQVVNNWFYVAANETILGGDQANHLWRTLVHNELLQGITPRTIFETLTWSRNRPPLRYLTVIPFYRLFGISTDVALMGNSLYVALLLLSVCDIGQRIYSRKVGLLATFLASIYPILFSLSRTSYVDYPLASIVALSVALLLRADGFRHRGFSLLFGLSLGLGVLTKWPFVAFLVAPLFYVIHRSGIIGLIRGDIKSLVRGSSTLPRLLVSPWVHPILAAILASVWYLPNWDRLARLLLGPWLLPLSWLLLWATLYLLTRQPTPGSNLISALLVGVTLASVSALPNIGYLRRAVWVGYSEENVWAVNWDLGDPLFYLRYLGIMFRQQLSPPLFLVLLLALAALLYRALRASSLRVALSRGSEGGWILALWLGFPLFFFTLTATASPRFLVPALPPAALLTAQGLLSLPWRRVRAILLVAVVSFGLLQFFALSYDRLGWVRKGMTLSLPGGHRVTILAKSRLIRLPNSGPTDSRYWIGPDMLDRIGEEMSSSGQQKARLVFPAYRSSLTTDTLRYLAKLRDLNIHVVRFDPWRGEGKSPEEILLRLYLSDYALLEESPSERLSPGAQQAMRILEEPPSCFPELFEPMWEYRLPDGNVMRLYRNRSPGPEGRKVNEYSGVAKDVRSRFQEGDALILDHPEQMRLSAAPQVCLGDFPPLITLGGLPDEGAIEEALDEIMAKHSRLFALFSDQGPESKVEELLNKRAYPAWNTWHGSLQLVLYASPKQDKGLEPLHPVRVQFSKRVALAGYSLFDEEVAPGRILRLTLLWESGGPLEEDHKVFVHLVDEQGQIIGQRDGEPVGGLRPTTTWAQGEKIIDNYGILVPESAMEGEYRLLMGIYLPTTGERMAVLSSDLVVVEESVVLGRIQVATGGER